MIWKRIKQNQNMNLMRSADARIETVLLNYLKISQRNDAN